MGRVLLGGPGNFSRHGFAVEDRLPVAERFLAIATLASRSHSLFCAFTIALSTSRKYRPKQRRVERNGTEQKQCHPRGNRLRNV
jgi:hypothetical protein